MKKLFLLFIGVTVLASCNTNSLEKIAEKRLRSTVLELAKNPDSYSISNLTVVYQAENDSSIVFSFIGKGQNGFGGYSSSNYEYYYNIEKDATYECLLDLDDNKSFSKTAEDLYEILASAGLDSEKEIEARNSAAMLTISTATLLKGREVKDK